MTREEAGEKLKKVMHKHYRVEDHICLKSFIHDVDFFVLQNYEAQLKAKNEEINRLKRDLTAYSMLLDEPQYNKL